MSKNKAGLKLTKKLIDWLTATIRAGIGYVGSYHSWFYCSSEQCHDLMAYTFWFVWFVCLSPFPTAVSRWNKYFSSNGQSRWVRVDGKPVHESCLIRNISGAVVQPESVVRFPAIRLFPHFPRNGIELSVAGSCVRTDSTRHILLVHQPGIFSVLTVWLHDVGKATMQERDVLSRQCMAYPEGTSKRKTFLFRVAYIQWLICLPLF